MLVSLNSQKDIFLGLVYYCAFTDKQKAKDFELYLKSGSGKAFAYKRLVAFAKYVNGDEKGIPKS